MSTEQTLSQDQQGRLWAELKKTWAIIKDQAISDSEKVIAKNRVNQIQAELKLDKTDFSQPYVKGETKTTTTTISAQTIVKPSSTSATNFVANGKVILQEFLDVAVPIASAKAKEMMGDNAPVQGLLITTEALLKPMGIVFGSLVKK